MGTRGRETQNMGNTGLTLLPPPERCVPPYTIQRGGGGGHSGGLKGHGDRTGQEASRAPPVPGPTVELVRPWQSGELGRPWRVRELGRPWRVRELGRPWLIRELGRPWRIRGFGVPWRILGLRRPWQNRSLWPLRPRAAPVPTPASTAGALLPPQKKNSLGKVGARSGTWGH